MDSGLSEIFESKELKLPTTLLLNLSRNKMDSQTPLTDSLQYRWSHDGDVDLEEILESDKALELQLAETKKLLGEADYNLWRAKTKNW